MKIERTKNATRNVAVGAALRLYQMIGPFILRTIMIYVLGMQYVGLNSLFTSILQVLSLAELGVGSAMVYSMYRPIAEDDGAKICMLMKLYRLYYRVIGGVICILGLVLLPVLPKLISGTVPAGINIYILYGMNLGATVLSYWMFAYKNSLLTAHQRNDVIDLITIVTTTIQYLFQIFTLVVLKSYYWYIVMALLSQALLNIATALVVNRMYPDYHPKGEIDRAVMCTINGKIKDLFTSKLGEVIVNSADTIVVSTFLGLTILAMYNNYYYILTAVMGFITLIFKSSMAGVGNSLVVEKDEKNYNDLKRFTFLIGWIAFVCSCCLLCLYQPFMEIWVGKEYMLGMGCVICFVCYFYIRVINQVLIVYKDAAGMWHEDRMRPLCTALINLILNLVFVQFMGLYGVLLSTVLSTLGIGMPWVIRNLFSVVLKRSSKEYVKQLLQYAAVSFVGCVVTYLLCSMVPGNLWVILGGRLVLCLVIPNILYVGIFHQHWEFHSTMQLVDQMLGKKLPILHKLISKVQ